MHVVLIIVVWTDIQVNIPQFYVDAPYIRAENSDSKDSAVCQKWRYIDEYILQFPLSNLKISDW